MLPLLPKPYKLVIPESIHHRALPHDNAEQSVGGDKGWSRPSRKPNIFWLQQIHWVRYLRKSNGHYVSRYIYYPSNSKSRKWIFFKQNTDVIEFKQNRHYQQRGKTR